MLVATVYYQLVDKDDDDDGDELAIRKPRAWLSSSIHTFRTTIIL